MAALTTILAKKRLFRGRLLRWYDAHRRELPWRETRDPYQIWISEIMLQQTRVNAVIGHYHRFLKTFPTVEILAKSAEADVLAAWSGLGYYRRARMMGEAAKKIVAAHGGRFPATADELQELPGIGRYTAAAIASIAYDEPRAVVDGNVERVVGRIAGRPPAQEKVWTFVQSVIPTERPGDFNQAMMELGATVCTPKAPRCGECPLRSLCSSAGRVQAPAGKGVRLSASLHYSYARRNGSVLLVQRDEQASLMAGMWELPLRDPAKPPRSAPLLKLRHSITTTDYEVFIHKGGAGRGRWVARDEIPALPLTGLARKTLVRLGAIASHA